MLVYVNTKQYVCTVLRIYPRDLVLIPLIVMPNLSWGPILIMIYTADNTWGVVS